MKAAVNNITESAKRRDTVGRNRVSVIKDTQCFGVRLFDYQNNYSSDNVEKLTTVILRDETSHTLFVLKYRAQIIVNGGDSFDDNIVDSKLFEEFLEYKKTNSKSAKVAKNEEGDDLNVNK